jgi:peptidoglycan/xylan/chitin deacetylase (PgdA/CDA1 family)
MQSILLIFNLVLLATFLTRLHRLGRRSIRGYLAFLPLACLGLSLVGGSLAGAIWGPAQTPRESSPTAHGTAPSPLQLTYDNPPWPTERPENPGEEVAPTTFSDVPDTVDPARPIVSRGPKNAAGFVAFVFDDGPHPQGTAKILDLLKEKGVKATFAVLGDNVRRYPELARRIVAEGHQIVNHGETHRSLIALDGEGQLEGEIVRTNDAIEKATGVRPAFIRPPYGETSALLAERIARNYGLRTLLWNVDPGDWKVRDPEVIFDSLALQTTLGSINVLHDSVPETLVATRRFLEELPQFRLVTVDELLKTEVSPDLTESTSPPARRLSFELVPLDKGKTTPSDAVTSGTDAPLRSRFPLAREPRPLTDQ